MQVDGLTNDEVKSHLQVGFIFPLFLVQFDIVKNLQSSKLEVLDY